MERDILNCHLEGYYERCFLVTPDGRYVMGYNSKLLSEEKAFSVVVSHSGKGFDMKVRTVNLGNDKYQVMAVIAVMMRAIDVGLLKEKNIELCKKPGYIMTKKCWDKIDIEIDTKNDSMGIYKDNDKVVEFHIPNVSCMAFTHEATERTAKVLGVSWECMMSFMQDYSTDFVNSLKEEDYDGKDSE